METSFTSDSTSLLARSEVGAVCIELVSTVQVGKHCRSRGGVRDENCKFPLPEIHDCGSSHIMVMNHDVAQWSAWGSVRPHS